MIRIGYTLSMMREQGRPYPDWELIGEIKKAGYDYVELPLNALVSLKEDELEHVKKLLETNEIACETVNQLLPADMRIVGPNMDEAAVETYLSKAEKILHELSVKRIIFGSASSKNLAVGYPEEKAMAQTVAFLHKLSGLLHPIHELIAIEPLNANEANFITNMEEGVKLVEAADRSNIGICADYYHMAVEQEPMEILKEKSRYVVQLHFCRTDRKMPLKMDEGMKSFLETAKAAGYEKRMTLEAKSSDPAELNAAADEVRKYL